MRLTGEQVESLFDEALPIAVRELPADLARLEELLSDPALLAPISGRWEAAARDRGRPTIAMSLFVRLTGRTKSFRTSCLRFFIVGPYFFASTANSTDFAPAFLA